LLLGALILFGPQTLAAGQRKRFNRGRQSNRGQSGRRPRESWWGEFRRSRP
jgi:hypothetical protein